MSVLLHLCMRKRMCVSVAHHRAAVAFWRLGGHCRTCGQGWGRRQGRDIIAGTLQQEWSLREGWTGGRVGQEGEEWSEQGFERGEEGSAKEVDQDQGGGGGEIRGGILLFFKRETHRQTSS